MPDTQRPSKPGFKLSGEVDGEVRGFTLTDGVQSLGRSRSAQIHLDTLGISRIHAEIDVSGESVRLCDMGSHNGTFVNDRRLNGKEPVPIAIGDVIRLGPVFLTLDAADAEDGELGLEIDQPFVGGSETTLDTLVFQEEGAFARAVDLLATIVELMTLPKADLKTAANQLRSVANLEMVAVLERRGSSKSPIALAVSGDTERLGDFPDSFVDSPDATLVEGTSLSIFARTGPGRPPPRLLLDGILRIVERLYSAPLPEGFNGLDEVPEPPATADLTLPAGIIRGRSPAMLDLYQQAASVARSNLPILLLGETGVGKEHLAEAIHLSSDRRQQSFAVVNCAAIPAEQLEAEMFGIGKGVATGVAPRPGCFVRAEGGTLFLDEIGEMPIGLQAKLLRALQEGQIHPVGLPPRSVDVRVVAATNADLDVAIAERKFRADLYYRLAGAELMVPSLVQRQEDLGTLMAYFLRRSAKETGKTVRGLSVKALRLLSQYPWPGNVRELEHEMRRLVLRSRPPQAIDSTLLSPRIQRCDPGAAAETGLDELADSDLTLEARLDALQARLITQALEVTAGNQTRTAAKLGLSRSGLIKKMKRLGIDAKKYSDL